MNFQDMLQLILSTGIPASTVLQAIHDSLEYVNVNSGMNSKSIRELESLLTLVQESFNGDESSPEVVLARSGKANLKARLDDLESRILTIDAEIELQKPTRVVKNRTQVIPFDKLVEYNTTLTPAQTYIRQQGVNGSSVITYEEEFVNGVSTGRIFNEAVTSTTAPISQITVQGTMIVNKIPIRYVRFSNKRAGMAEGRFVELEVFAGATNIAKNVPVTIPNGATQTDKAALFDGAKQYWSSNVSHANPYVQIDLGSARTDITRIEYYLYPLVNYDSVQVDVSQDGKTWRRIVNLTNHYVGAVGESLSLDVTKVYGTPLSTFIDTGSGQNVAIGGTYTIISPSIRLYWDSDRALAKNTSQSGVWTQKGSHTVLNRRTVNGTTVYGFSIGWIRDEDNVG